MLKKIAISIVIFMILFNFSMNVHALEISQASLTKIGTADYHLKYYREDRGYASYVICSIVGYNNQNKFYPAYCMNKDLPGAESGEYTVNINEILNNPAVWRVVTNGYPYLEPYQMGLPTKYDAYAVTKMAIYCVLGQSRLDYYSADESDSVGCHMVNVLKYLVNLGVNGTDTPSTGTLNVNKNGNLIESNEHYYQEYLVSSRINLENYKIENISNFPEGSFVANVQNNPQNVFNNGESFRVFIPKSKLVNDINGNISISSKVKNYPIFYGQAPSGKQDYIITYDTYGEEKINVNFNMSVNTGSLVVTKTDSENGKYISGIKFELARDGTNEKYYGITDENGKIQFNNIRQGKYILKEIETSENYILNENFFEVNIQYNKLSNLSVQNDIKRGQIKIIKTDADTNKFLKDIKFEIINKNTNEVVETLITDENGEALSSELRIDNEYYVREVETNENYELDETPIDIVIEYNEVTDLNISNTIKKGEVKIIKIDEDTKEFLEGVQFEIVNKSTEEVIETLITDENGEALSSELRIDGEYYIREIKPKIGYEENTNIYDIELEEKNIVEILIENKKIFIPKEEPKVEVPIKPVVKIEEVEEIPEIVEPKKLPKTGM